MSTSVPSISRGFHAGARLGLAGLLCALLSACGGHSATTPPLYPGSPTDLFQNAPNPNSAAGKIKHIVVLIQENRSFDNIFYGFTGANYATEGLDSAGKEVKLKPISFAADWDLCHSFNDAVEDIDGGKMNGFDHCVQSGPTKYDAYTYVEPSQTAKYFTLAKQYGISDDFFSSQLDDSFIGHQYLIASYAGTALNYPTGVPWGCDAPKGTTITLHDGKKVFPCFVYDTLAKDIDAKKLTWRYYAPSSVPEGYIWSAYDAIKYIREGGDWSKYVVSPQCQVLQAAKSGDLPDVTWVVPDTADSDHPLSKSTTGPAWVTDVVNAIGKSSLWSSTAIFVVWDDWGGFYDHVVPPSVDWDGEGMRVPFIAISPYSKVGGISHGPKPSGIYEFTSIVKTIEGLFGLPVMDTVRDKDASIKSLFTDTALFDFSQAPRAFKPLPNSGYSCNGSDYGPPDTDFGPPGSSE